MPALLLRIPVGHQQDSGQTAKLTQTIPSRIQLAEAGEWAQLAADAARDAAAQLTSALLNPHPAAPFAPMAEDQMHALRKLAEIFT